MTTKPSQEIPKAYEPKEVEQRLYLWWESSGFFTPSVDPAKQPYTIMMPPPNVTGELHLGHALTTAVEDALIRYHRMRGYAALWVPGADHAGIATQMVVEREMAKQGIDRHKLGREAFLRGVWDWVDKYGNVINKQLRRLGASCDWTHKRFTMDPGPSRAVRTTFKRLYDKGLIYRGERMINWCPTCRTALSDLEVDHQDEQGALYYIRYRLEESNGHVTVATTRPETLLGDTAVAVNPGDDRFSHLKGKRVVLPVLGRAIPIIEDEAVASDFGTGALKITPGHDPTDFEMGQRHHLPIVNILNPNGTLNDEAGPYQGFDRFDARKAIVEQLEREGLLEKIEDHQHSVGHCDRSGDIVEPIVSEQWFVHVAPLAKRAMEVVEQGRIKMVPERFTKVYVNWMENIHDWCISRQLWWGHRIPVWYCADCQHLTVDVDDPEACEQCGSASITQDEDVLDTWFSSSLWPHSTLGWPDDTEELRYFHPTDVLETGYDILFFWVARMIMLGLENMDEIPFHTVYLHGLIRDEQGQKMSKTKGNVVDPLQLADEYGTDALRFALSTGTSPGNDSRISSSKIQAARNFANKLWNASRYVLSTLENAADMTGWQTEPPRTHREDQWILSRLDQVSAEMEGYWREYQFGQAQYTLHDFIWGEFCDWYIELAKVRLRSGDTGPHRVLAFTLDRLLRLLHPFMPFVTEELWQQLKARLPAQDGMAESIMLAPYPEPSGQPADGKALKEIALVMETVRAIRNVRAEFHVEPQRSLDALIAAPSDRDALEAEAEAIRHMARVGTLEFVADRSEATASSDSITVVVQGGTSVTLPLGGVVDMEAERRRLQAELTESEKHAQGLSSRLNSTQFTSKAPEEVVERERQRLADLQARRLQLRALMTELDT